MSSDLLFVVGQSPEQLKATSARQIRSHLARRGWTAHTSKAIMSKRTRKRRAKEKNTSPMTAAHEDASSSSSNGSECSLLALNGGGFEPQATPVIVRRLGSGRIDPFATLPGAEHPFVPRLVDHYLSHMAVDIPELDQPDNTGLLRKRWFPLAASERSTFYTLLLLSASNIAALKQELDDKAFSVLQLKAAAIASINDAFSKEIVRTSDAVIGAVAKMASYEAMQGDLESYRIHMQGLKRMITLRGGLSYLGLGGLLRRIVVWIDINSSFLLKLPRTFPGEGFTECLRDTETNLERFIAA